MLIDLHIDESGHIEVTRHGEYPPPPWRLTVDFPAREGIGTVETIDDPNIYESAGGLWVDTIEHGPMPASRWYRLMR
ncbi:MAG: hypothetical protein H6970_01160 [Gammaproteobacteria bacterium]|nr:hypothetical protein [Gammaproteobacteria bacterium]MCP5423666.1 hypothetical protein [Gammaproteobacteria bacterium]